MPIKDKNIFNNIVDAFESFAIFTKERWRATLIGMFFLIIMLSVGLMAFWVYRQIDMLNNSSEVVKDLLVEHNPTPEKMQELLAETTKQNKLIDKVLSDDILSVAGDRAYLIRFHNGQKDINGTHFMFMSTTNEVQADGITNEMVHFQKVPTNFTPTRWLTELLDGNCVAEEIKNLPETLPIRSLMLSMGIQKMKICPITNLETGNLLGVVGTSWVTELPDTEDCINSDNAMRNANAKLSAILTIN